MAMIEFVRNYSDHSTDRGYQFEFRCDHCSSGYMSSYKPSALGAAGSILEAASSIFGGFLGGARDSAYDIQRAIGGKAHDSALQEAVAEVKQKFSRCQRCGKWVCNEICWNTRAQQCTGCTPKYEQEIISQRTHAQLRASQQQLEDKAATTDYVSGIDVRPDVQVEFNHGNAEIEGHDVRQLPASANPATAAAAAVCAACKAPLTGGKFCGECGAPVARACPSCGTSASATAKFCNDCGTKL